MDQPGRLSAWERKSGRARVRNTRTDARKRCPLRGDRAEAGSQPPGCGKVRHHAVTTDAGQQAARPGDAFIIADDASWGFPRHGFFDDSLHALIHASTFRAEWVPFDTVVLDFIIVNDGLSGLLGFFSSSGEWPLGMECLGWLKSISLTIRSGRSPSDAILAGGAIASSCCSSCRLALSDFSAGLSSKYRPPFNNT